MRGKLHANSAWELPQLSHQRVFLLLFIIWLHNVFNFIAIYRKYLVTQVVTLSLLNLANPDSFQNLFTINSHVYHILRSKRSSSYPTESQRSRFILNAIWFLVPRWETSARAPTISNPTITLSLTNICEFIFFDHTQSRKTLQNIFGWNLEWNWRESKHQV